MEQAYKKYVEQTKHWAEEQKVRIEELDNTIQAGLEVAELNRKQKRLLMERANIVIEDYNKWAEEHGYERIYKFPIPKRR